MTPTAPSRRAFLASGAATAAAAASSALLPARAHGAPPLAADVAFWHVSDTHFLGDETRPGQVDEQSARVNDKVIDLLNSLPGTRLPDSVGGGTLPATINGVVHTGDLIDSGDKQGPKFADLQKAEFAAYQAAFGLTGRDGKLKYPVYELHGNHDGPHGKGLALDGIVARNKTRPGVAGTSANGLHYSWDFGPIHLVSVGIVAGDSPATARQRRYAPLGSHAFLVDDLKQRVGDSGRPVVVCCHVDVARYTGACDATAPYENKNEWDPCDVHAFFDALRPYNTIAVLYGHTHVRKVFKWDGRSAAAADGIDVFNVDDASHFRGAAHGLFHFHLSGTQLTVREYATKDHWQTAQWAPVLTKQVSLGKPA